MSILAFRSTQVLIQGITGSLGQNEARKMLAYGTKVVAGVTPGKGGQTVLGVPVYDTIAEACAQHRIDVVTNYVPARLVKESALEAIRAGVPQVNLAAERIPLHDVAEILAVARRHGARVLGPNTLGVASPGKSILGGIGGDHPEKVLMPGPVGVMSTSGGMGVETVWTLKRAGIGTSTFVATGGEAIVGTSFRDLLELFQADPETKAVVMFSEPGSKYEEEVADFILGGGFTKPAFALVVGRFTESMPGVRFGHGRAIIEGGKGGPMAKIAALESAGVCVVQRLSELPPLLARVC